MDFRTEQIRHITGVENAVKSFKEAVTSALYEATRAQKAADNRDYKDFTAEAAGRMRKQAQDQIAANLATQIKQARQDLKADAGRYLQHMRDDFSAQTARMPASKAVLDVLRVYHDLDIPMTEADVKALAAEAGGNLLTLRALSSVAAESGIKVNIPSSADYIRLADNLEKAIDTAGLAEFIDIPAYVSAEGGAVTAQIHIAAFISALNQLSNIKAVIEGQGITISKGESDEDTTEKETQARQARKAAAAAVEVEGSEGLRIAIEHAKNQAQGAATAQKAIDAYTVGG